MKTRLGFTVWTFTLTVLTTASILLLGCGGDSSKSTTTAVPSPAATSTGSTKPSSVEKAESSSGEISLPEAIKRAEAICLILNKELDQSDIAVGKLDVSGIYRLTTLEIPLEQTAVTELANLKPSSYPPGWKDAIKYRRGVIATLINIHRYAGGKKEKKMREEYVNFHEVQRKLLAAAKRAGFDACSITG